ncbi:unnamed protein product, partial [Rotaria sp. Silwood2]
ANVTLAEWTCQLLDSNHEQ